jgi:HK97 family phage portal protein
MGILRRIADRFDPPAPETRAVGDPIYSAIAELSGTRAINPRLAENLSTVLACVGAIAGGIASLPVWVYRRTPNGRELLENHPIMGMIRNGPNRYQTWPDFLEWWIASTLLRGNGLAEIKRDYSGTVTELMPIPWEHASVSLLPSGRLAYDVTSIQTVYGGTGKLRRVLDSEAIHLRDRSDDGLLGRSRLQRAASVVSVGLAVQEHAASMFENQATPNGAIRIDQHLTPDQKAKLRENVTTGFTGAANARKLLILEAGMQFQQISLSAEDAELLASRRFSTEELARLYQVPPPIIGDLTHGTFTNAETTGRWFAQHTLSPWIRKIETELQRSLLSESARQSIEIEIDLTGLLRGDPETRWQSHKIAVESGILDVNEIREMEGFNPKQASTA